MESPYLYHEIYLLIPIKFAYEHLRVFIKKIHQLLIFNFNFNKFL